MIYDLYEIIYCQPLTIKHFFFISWLSFFKELYLFIYKLIIFSDIYHLDLSTSCLVNFSWLALSNLNLLIVTSYIDPAG